MKLQELLISQLIKTNLFEMAFDRQTAINRIVGIERVLNLHLIKYFYFNDVSNKHWLIEIIGFIETIDDIYVKPKSSKLSNPTYFEKLYMEPFDKTKNVQKQINRLLIGEYSNVKTRGLDFQQVENCLLIFHSWLCPLIANDTLQQSEIELKLNEIILQQ